MRYPTPALRALAALIAVLALAACRPAFTPPAPSARCTYGHENGQLLPDPGCTPGALNPAVTQGTIRTTICVAGWTATVRPPLWWSSAEKVRSRNAYGQPRGTVGELDHLIPLELGGAPASHRNLWFEPGKIPNPKDAVESVLRRAVCSGRITLGAAQRAIESDWTRARARLGI